jgi:spore maturation protein CgeB
MKILYAGVLSAGSSSLFRTLALERLGHTLIKLDPDTYFVHNPLLARIAFRMAAGPHADRLNRDLVQLAEAERPDVLWADKVLLLKPSTLSKMRDLGILTVSYMIDNAFGPRRDPGWRRYMQNISLFDLHVTQRDVSVRDYLEHGARDAMKVQTAYEPTVHFPSAKPITDAERTREVSFIGTPYDDRAEILSRLNRDGVPVVVSGDARVWSRALSPEAYAAIYFSGELYNQQYREAIWRSKMNLSFLTRSNQDEYTHKSFEIAGCGGFLMAERSQGHELKFREGQEAVFFDSYEDLLLKIRQYLPDEANRNRIAAAGQRRAFADGYHNDRQMTLILERLAAIRCAQPSGSLIAAQGRA